MWSALLLLTLAMSSEAAASSTHYVLLLQDQTQALAVLALALLQTVLIIGLLVERRRHLLAARQRNEAEMRERQELADLAHVDRVAMLGALIASIAHELNQPLGAILLEAETALALLERPSSDKDMLHDIIEDVIVDARRAGEVIQRMRALLKKGELQYDWQDLNHLVDEVARMVANDSRLRGVTLTLALEPTLPAVRGDAVQLQQVVLNLVVNAMDAVAERPPGQRHVWVHTRADSARVELSVADSGTGLREQVRAHLFESFFTTKKGGMGLGLHISHSILEAHGGSLTAENGPQGGALFRCTLPAKPREETKP